MTSYSDEKNQWRQKEQRINNTIQETVFYKHHADGYKDGYLAGEKDKSEELAFTEEEKRVFVELLVQYQPAMLVPIDHKALESLKKKVLGK